MKEDLNSSHLDLGIDCLAVAQPLCPENQASIGVYLHLPRSVTSSNLCAMASAKKCIIPHADLQSFTEYLGGCKRIIALLGAGISASSGLPTFRGAGGLWRSYDATSLATPEAFEENPGLVWQFYSYRRHMALQAEPNKAHYALAELARKNEHFITLSQNVDGMNSCDCLLLVYTDNGLCIHFRSFTAGKSSFTAIAFAPWQPV